MDDRVILGRRNHLIDGAAGRVLVRIDLQELIDCVNSALRTAKTGKTDEEWFQEGVRLSQNPKTMQQAISAYREAMKINPHRADAYVNTGKIHYQEGNLVDAERLFRMAILRDAYNAVAHYSLGRVMEDLGCLDDAMLCYQKTIEIAPRLAAAHYRMSRVCAGAGLIEKAVRHFNLYLELAPDGPRADSLRRELEDLQSRAAADVIRG